MADTRYLKRRLQGWYFVIAVPRQLRAKAGKAFVVRSLQTRDLTTAQKLRWPQKIECEAAFERLATDVPLTPAEIGQEARRAYEGMLAALEAVKASAEPQEAPEGEAPDTPELAGLRVASWNLEEAMEQSDLAVVAEAIRGIVKRTGAKIEPGTKTYDDLGMALLEAQHAAIVGRMAALQGKPSEPPDFYVDPVTLKPAKAVPRVRIKSVEGKACSELAALYIAELQRDKTAKSTEQTRGQHEMAFRLLVDFTNDAPLAAIDRATASRFLEMVARLDPHWGRSPDTKKLSLAQLIEKFGNGDKQLSNKTLNRYIASLSGLFKWARKRGHFDGANPFSEQGREKPRKGTTGWLPYTVDELNVLFAAPLFQVPLAERIRPDRHSVESALRWVPLIALFSGMRLGEICQLRTADLRSEGKVWYFNVSEEGEGQSVKTEAGARHVPVHSTLVKYGMLDYLSALPTGQLFPSLTPGGPDGKLSWYFTRRYTEFRRVCGIERDRLSFHSFRKNVSTALDNAGVAQADIAALIGHERGFTLETYSKGLEMARLQGIVEKVQYPGLRLTHPHVSSPS